MNHLSQAELNDYARGLAAVPHPHLAECLECANLVSFLRKVSESAATFNVPSEVIELAKRIFPDEHAVNPAPGLRHVLAKLISLQASGQQLAEVRSMQASAKQALYRHGDFCIDLRSQEEPDSIKTALVGQIGNQRDPLKPIGRVPVTLVSGKRILQQTECNALGEFLVDFGPKRRLRLRFDLASEGLTIDVPLRDLSNED